MYCINLESYDPFLCLALEEVLLKQSTEDFFLLAVNDPCVVIGKHQVSHREADTKFVTESGIPVIRRLSGGGAVFHDRGNLNFSFILGSTEGMQIDFRKYTLPVINFLSSLGLDVKFEGRNDLRIDGLKISGNAEHVHGKRVLHHGTLLFDSSLDFLRRSLRKDTMNYSSHAVQSNPSHVMNLKEKINIPSLDLFREKMLNWNLKNLPATPYSLGKEQMEPARSLSESKYRTWEWNYAYGPEYHFRKSFLLGKEYISCRLFVKDEIIWECRIEGNEPMELICRDLIGIRHMPDSMLKIFREKGIMIKDEEIFLFF